MKVFFKLSFVKDLKRLPVEIKAKIEKACFETFPEIKSLSEFNFYPLQKMKGHLFYYRIRFGDYRVGLKKTDGEVIFMRALHRKDIYRFFP